MKIGINCKWNWIVEEKVVNKLKKAGINIIEISYKEKKYIPKDEIEFLKGLGFDYSVHAPYECIKLKAFPWPRYSKRCIREVDNSLNDAIKLKASHFVVHGGAFIKGFYRFKNLVGTDYGLRFSLNRFINNFDKVFKKAEKHGIKVVIENLYPCFMCGRVFDIKYIQEKLPSVGLCLDFGHSEIYNLTGELFKLRIDHVHVSDNNKKEDQHLKIGDGMLDFNKLLKELNKKKYDGKIIIECKNLEEGINSFEKLNKKLYKDNKILTIVKK
ncbi:MAG TPA: sugar phosphate isomerase/epimerase family protein [Candidatus Nanoarchaeia archaeon]|nr:sugar phosphate isomerase/epimerase family protein [Candidatus Nanoarchaeia archaeon]